MGNIKGGLLWSLSSRTGTQLLQLGFGIALARLLGPAEFGTVGMLLIFSGFAQTLADTGLTSALIYKEGLQDRDSSTVFWFQLLVGVLLTFLFYGCADTLASFFHDPRLARLARLMSLIFVIGAPGQVHSVLLRREGRFKYIAVLNIVATAVSGVVALILAFGGFGAEALLWQMLVSTFIMTILNWRGLDWRPSLTFSLESMREVGLYGSYLLGHSSLNYWLRNGDNLVIGRFLGTVDLGIYARAYSLMLLPINNVSAVFGQVMFPALSRVQNDAQAFRDLYLKSIRLIAFISFPLMAGAGLLATQVVLILFGSEWDRMIPIFAILSVVGLFQSIVFPVGWVFTALGRTKEQFSLSILLLIAFAIAMAIGIQYGLFGVTLAYAIWTAISGLANIRISNRLMNLRLANLFHAISKVTLATVVMSGAVYLLNTVIVERLPLIISAMLCTLAGVAVYGAVCLQLGEDSLKSVFGTIPDLSRRFARQRAG